MSEQAISICRPSDRLAFASKSIEARLQALVVSGFISWNGKKFQPDTSGVRP